MQFFVIALKRISVKLACIIVMMSLSIKSIFSMEDFKKRIIAYPLTTAGNGFCFLNHLVEDSYYKPFRYVRKHYTNDTKRKILELEPSSDEIEKNKRAYEALRFFLENMDNNTKLRKQVNLTQEYYIALDRGPYAANYIYDILFNSREVFDCYDEVCLAMHLLKCHGPALFGSADVVTTLGVIGQEKLAVECSGNEQETNKFTKLKLIKVLLKYAKVLASSLDQKKLLEEPDSSLVENLMNEVKSYYVFKVEE